MKVWLGILMKKILIVDDTSLIRFVADRAAKDAGYDTVLAKNGQKGLEALQNHDIDFIFSDVNMPIMGGLEMVMKIKADARYKDIPIVMLTTENKTELKLRGKALGVKGWLLKPFNDKMFVLTLEKLLGVPA